jgi:phospholipid/cholesterol/gamma-HCH transport system substrate-binding protein
MDTRLNYILIGLFVLGLGAAFILGVLWLSTGDLRLRYERYLVYTSESVSGLGVDSAVRYRGVNVGRVAAIQLLRGDPTRVRLALDIVENTPVKANTVATLEMQGLTGLMSVNLTGGTADAPPPPIGAEGFPVIDSKPSPFAQLEEKAATLLDRLNQTTEGLNAVLNEQNRASLARVITNLDQLTASARTASESLPQLAAQLRASAAAVERMAEQIGATSESVRAEVEVNGQELRRFMGSTLPEAGAVMDELRETAANLRRTSELVERDPSVLLYGGPAPVAGPGE